MSALINGTALRVRPDHRMIGIADAAARTAQESTVPGEGFLGVSPNEVLIGTGQDGMDVQLRLETWDGPPPPPRDPEFSETARLDLPTGRVCIDLTLNGWISDVLQTSPGNHQIRVAAWDRTWARDTFWTVGRRTDFRADNSEFAALCTGALGTERYVAQLWRSTQPSGRGAPSR